MTAYRHPQTPFVAPYVIHSGKNVGKSLEELMFANYPIVRYMLNKANEKPYARMNEFHRHLAWLVAQGENRLATMTCPICGNWPVANLSAVHQSYGISVHWQYTCCEMLECQDELIARTNGLGQILPMKFSILADRISSDRASIVRVFKSVFDLPDRITQKIAFEFFCREGCH